MINIIKSLHFLINTKTIEFYKLPFRIGRKTSIEISKTAKIIFSSKGDRLYLNRKWTKKNPFYTHLTMAENSEIRVTGVFSFYPDTKIGLYPNAILELGAGFINSGLTLTVREKISIGNNVIIGPNCTIRDTDDHSINGNPISSEITIKDNVWIGANVIILKGVTIEEGVVISAGALVNKSIKTKSLAGGIPAKILRENITWD